MEQARLRARPAGAVDCCKPRPFVFACAPQKFDLSLSNLSFKAIFVTQPTENQC